MRTSLLRREDHDDNLDDWELQVVAAAVMPLCSLNPTAIVMLFQVSSYKAIWTHEELQ